MKKIMLYAGLIAGVISAAQSAPETVLVDTGSTNTPGMTISMPAKGKALLERTRGGGGKERMSVTPALKARLMKDLEAAAPVDQLNARHCAKSASFGSRVFVEFKGVRSPDISCPGQTDPKVEALRTDVEEIMAEARKK